MMSILSDGFLGSRLYAISPAIRLEAKPSMLRCLVCSMWQTFLSSSLTVSMSALFRSRILSCRFMSEFFMFFLSLVTRCMSSMKSLSKSSWLMYPPVGKNLSEEPLRKVLVLQWFTVVHVSRRECSLYYLATVVYHYMHLESVEPSHRALALGSPSLHRPVAVRALYVA